MSEEAILILGGVVAAILGGGPSLAFIAAVKWHDRRHRDTP